MSTTYVVQRLEQTRGPQTAAELRQLVAQGEVRPDDLIQREGTSDWIPAHKVKGLFDADEKQPEPPPPPDVTGSQVTPPQAASHVSEMLARWRPFAEHYSREFDLSMNHFLAVAAGSVCLFLLALSTLLTWEQWAMQMGGAMPGVGDSRSYSGLDVLEGKLVCLLAVIGIAAFFAALVMKRLFPVCLLVAAAVGTCSVLLTLSYKHQIADYDAEAERSARAIAKNYDATFGEEGGKEMSDLVIPREMDTAGIGLFVSLLASLVVAVTFVSAAIIKPVPLKFMQTDAVHPVARKHGGLLITQATAFLIGLANYVLRY